MKVCKPQTNEPRCAAVRPHAEQQRDALEAALGETYHIVNADHRTQALSLARQLMEQQMATPYASLPLGTSNGTQILNHTQRRGAKPDHEYLYAVDVSQPDPSKDVKKVVVQVKWSRQERNSEVTLVSSKGRMW